MTVANHSQPFVLSCLNRLIGYFIFAKLATHTPTWPQLGQDGSELYTASFLCFFPLKQWTSTGYVQADAEMFANAVRPWSS